MPREQLGSRLGFILLSAGCAIGIGNVWKFPYMVGQYGGGVFVLIYLFFLVHRSFLVVQKLMHLKLYLLNYIPTLQRRTQRLES